MTTRQAFFDGDGFQDESIQGLVSGRYGWTVKVFIQVLGWILEKHRPSGVRFVSVLLDQAVVERSRT